MDDLAQRDAFAGSFTGTYTNAGGKQHRDPNPCIEYYVAPKGTWALFPLDRNLPANFALQVTPQGARWTGEANAQASLVTVFDAETLSAPRGNAIVWQTIRDARSNRVGLDEAPLVSGRAYVLAVTVIDGRGQRISFGSRRFVAP